MTRTSLANSLGRRGVAGIGALALTGTALTAVALAGPAHAATGDLTYVCSVDGTDRNVGVNTDTNLPVKVTAGSTTGFTVTSALSIPRAVFQDAATAGAVSVQGTVTARAGIGGEVSSYPLALTAPLPASGDLSATASGQGQLVAPAQGNQDLALKAQNLTAQLSYRDAAGAQVGIADFTCVAPDPAVTIDTVAVASVSTTTVAVTPATIVYGQVARATATVTTAQGKAAGQVQFKVGDASVTTALDGTGKASVDLPRVDAGSRTVTATFLPTDALHYDESTSTAAPLKVKKDSAKSDLTLTYKLAERRLVAKNTVRTGQGTKPQGQVQFVLRRNGEVVAKVKKNLNDKGKTTYWFRNVTKKGTYKVTTKFMGATSLKKSKDIQTLSLP